jgi:serine/threonine-protein kinase
MLDISPAIGHADTSCHPPHETPMAESHPAPDVTTDLPASPKADTGARADTSVAPQAGGYATGDYTPSVTGAYSTAEKNDDFDVDEVRPAVLDIPGYEVIGELGRGGMGVVYHARQIGLNRLVALKMILAGPHASSTVINRFIAEAQAVARFQHPNIVQVFEVGEHAGLPYFSLEYVDGGTLAKKVHKEPQPPRYAAAVVEQLARAMQYAHERGIVHRDLKPANILLAADGTPKVTDFGLAKQLEGDSGQTQSGQVLGTPSYMAPEQARGEVEHVGPLADVYALGAILYDLLTGRPPFAGSSLLDTLEMVRTREPVPPGQFTGKLPRDIETICLKCLQKDPAKRYATAGELADDLKRFLEGRPIVARPVGAFEKAWRWAKRNPVGAAAVLLAVAVLVVPSILSWQLFVANGVAEAAKKNAEEERDQKEIARKAEEAAKLTAVAEEKKAKEAREVAGEQRKVALDTIRTVLIDIDNEMRTRTTLAPIRLRIIDKMLGRLDSVRDTALKNPLEDRTEGLAYGRIGMIYSLANRFTDASLWLRKSYAICSSLVANEPDDEINLKNASIISHDLGRVEARLGNTARARELHAESLKFRRDRLAVVERLVKDGKLQQRDLTEARNQVPDSMGLVAFEDLRLGRPAKALEQLQAANAAYQALPNAHFWDVRTKRAECLTQIGHALVRMNKLPEAEKAYLDGLKVREETLKLTPAKAQPQHNITRNDVAQSRLYLGDYHQISRGDAAAAIIEYDAAMNIFASLLKEEPDNLEMKRRVAAVHYRLGHAETHRRTSGLGGMLAKKAAGRRHFEQCLAIREGLAAIDKKDVYARTEVMLALARLGRAAEVEKHAAALLAQKDLDLAARYQVACSLAVASGAEERLQTQCFAVLSDLVAGGWQARGDLETEPDLAAIRSDERFTKLLSTIPTP